MQYLALFAIVFGINLLPAFGPPTWAVLVFTPLHWHLNLWVPKTSSGAPTWDDVPERTPVLAERPTSRIR